MPTLSTETARQAIDTISLLILATALVSVLVSRLDHMIVLIAGQGVLLVIAVVVVALATRDSHAYYAVLVTLAAKVIVVPGILSWLRRELAARPEVEFVVSPRLALPGAIALTLIAYYICAPLETADGFLTRNALPAAVSMLLIGLLDMLNRDRAFSQVVCLIIMENGIYLAAVVATQGLPLGVEIGAAAAIVIGAGILSYLVLQIQRVHGSDQMTFLRTLRF